MSICQQVYRLMCEDAFKTRCIQDSMHSTCERLTEDLSVYGREREYVCMWGYVYVGVCVHVSVCLYICRYRDADQ